MTKNQYKEKLAKDIASIMAATLMDTNFQGSLLEPSALTFAEEIMNSWLWKQIDSDARDAQERVRYRHF